MLNPDTIREATRLTHSGQLAEATALLQRMLRGERAPDAKSRTPGSVSLPGREPPTIWPTPWAPAVIRSSKGWLLARNARREARPAVHAGHRA
jgi:hypothetical protein